VLTCWWICHACGESELKNQISAAGLRLKGSGWYETDFKGGNKKKSNESSPEKSPGKSSVTKADSSSASKAQTETK